MSDRVARASSWWVDRVAEEPVAPREAPCQRAAPSPEAQVLPPVEVVLLTWALWPCLVAGVALVTAGPAGPLPSAREAAAP
jgi:hypothetical protein